MINSYSIRIGDNAIEMAYKLCPTDSFKCASLFTPCASSKTHLIRTKIKDKRSRRPYRA